VPHEKKTVIDKDTVFACRNQMLPALKRTDDRRYLGISFTPEGKMAAKISQQLQDAICKLTKTALKPQQRLFALRTMVIPGIYHQLELGNTSLSQLKKCDRIARHAVRKWLSLPGDSPNAYNIHANVKDGGLGIDAVRYSAPMRRLSCLRKLPLALTQTSGVPGAFLCNEINMCNKRLMESNVLLATHCKEVGRSTICQSSWRRA